MNIANLSDGQREMLKDAVVSYADDSTPDGRALLEAVGVAPPAAKPMFSLTLEIQFEADTERVARRRADSIRGMAKTTFSTTNVMEISFDPLGNPT